MPTVHFMFTACPVSSGRAAQNLHGVPQNLHIGVSAAARDHRMVFGSRAIATWGLLATAACPHGSLPPSDAPTEPTREDLEWRMLEHFDAVAQIRDAVVVGELTTVAEVSGILAREIDIEDYPATWRPHVATLRLEATQLSTPRSVADAAAGAARLAGACGACHEATRTVASLGGATPPSDDDTLSAQMQRHQWAVERMWEGIVGPLDVAWEEGVGVFEHVPGCNTERRSQCEAVVAAGRNAARATGTERVRAYGQLLSTCASCHATSPP